MDKTKLAKAKERIKQQIKTETEYSPNDKETKEFVSALSTALANFDEIDRLQAEVKALKEENANLKSMWEGLRPMGKENIGMILFRQKTKMAGLEQELATLKEERDGARGKMKLLLGQMATLKVEAKMGNIPYKYHDYVKVKCGFYKGIRPDFRRVVENHIKSLNEYQEVGYDKDLEIIISALTSLLADSKELERIKSIGIGEWQRVVMKDRPYSKVIATAIHKKLQGAKSCKR